MNGVLPTVRRAVALDAHGGPEVMRIVEEAAPAPGAGDVLLAVEAIGVNFGDSLIRQGTYMAGAPLSVRPGFEVAGTVLAAPEGSPHRVGSRAVAFVDDGGYATVVAVPEDRVQAIPDELSSVDAAALLIQGLTAWFAVRRFGAIAAGEHVLIHAAGSGVGALAVQLAAADGATVIGSASTPAKRDHARSLGADACIDSRADDLKRELRAVTPTDGLDVVLDGVGGPVMRSGMAALGRGGRYVVLGAASQEPSTLDLRRLMFGTKRVQGFVLADLESLHPGATAAAFRELAADVAAGTLVHPVRTLPFERVVEAHEALEQRAGSEKLVLTV